MRTNDFNPQELESLILHYRSEERKLNFQLEQVQGILNTLQSQADVPALTEKKVEETVVIVPEVKSKAKGKTKAKAKTKTRAKAKTEEVVSEEPKKRRGRPRKNATVEATTEAASAPAPRKRGRPKKEETVAAKPAKKQESKIRTLQEEESKPKGYRLSDWDLFIVNTIRKSNRALVNSDLMEKALIRVKKEKLDMDEMTLRGKLNRSIHKLSNKRGDLIKVDYPGKGFAYGLAEWADETGVNIREEYKVSMN